MSEMVERLARKLEPKAWAALGAGDTLAYENRRKSSIRKARLCIEEMRVPTPEMEQAYYKACDVNGMCLWKHAYRAMIDGALAIPSDHHS